MTQRAQMTLHRPSYLMALAYNPIPPAGSVLFQLKSGRISAPRLPQPLQTRSVSRDSLLLRYARQRDLARDEAGVELASVDQTKTEAARALAELANEALPGSVVHTLHSLRQGAKFTFMLFQGNGFRAAAYLPGAIDSMSAGINVIGKKYLAEQAATMLKFARATADPDVAAGFIDKAVELTAKIEEAPKARPQAPDEEQPEG